MQSIEQKVDALTGNPTGRRKSKRTHKLLVPLLVIGLVAVASASILILYSEYTGSQTGDIELTGIGTNIYFDGTPMSGETFTVPMDITTLIAGDTETYPHTAEVEVGDGDWDLSFIQNWDFSNSEHEFYGFTMKIENSLDEDILNDTIYLKAGEPVFNMNFIYELDSMFAHTVNALPYDLSAVLSEHVNVPCDAIADTYEIAGINYEQTCNVLLNDVDFEGDDLEIISVTTPTEGTAVISGTIPNQVILYESNSMGSPATFSYTISDGTDTDTAVVTMTS